MDKSMLVGVAIGAVSVFSVGAVGSYVVFKAPRYAEVLSVKPVKEGANRERRRGGGELRG